MAFSVDERVCWIFLNHIPELGPVRFHRLLQVARSAEAILRLSVAELQAAEVSEEVAQRWARAFQDLQVARTVEKELAWSAQGRFGIVTELDADYPAALRELIGRPPVLYYKGKWPLSQVRTLALVGTRRPSSYGIAVAQRLSADLVAQGVRTVSGLACGIDTCVHRSTLDAGGFTVAVLGCGLGQVFPRANVQLQKEIGERGLVVSEFPYEVEALAEHFPQRNRIISGLSEGVVVIEAGWHSGALITARFAAEQGRDVFAVPGSVFSPTSLGCHRLIREGAKLVETVSDVLEEMSADKLERSPLQGAPKRPEGLNAIEEKVFAQLSEDPMTVDQIALSVDLSFEQLANALLSLELKGIIRNVPGQRYALSYAT
jgi:DNA processing protein